MAGRPCARQVAICAGVAGQLSQSRNPAATAKAAARRQRWAGSRGCGRAVAEARLEAVEDALREAEGRRAEEDQLFAEARMARRTLEKLRERREADHALETGREEQRDLDELTRPSPKDPDMERTA